MKSLAVLISNAGSGTNLQAIIDATDNKKLKAKISVVISSDKDAYGIVRAKKNKIPWKICTKKDELLEIIKKYNPDFICLAGWRQIISEDVLDLYKNRILNIHPGLVPNSLSGNVLNPDKTTALWNRGKLTQVAIQNFLDNNATYAGSSVHFLSNDFDFGKVIARCFEKIKKDDDAGSLYKRLKMKENKMYVSALIKLCN